MQTENRMYFYWNWMGCNLLRKFSASDCHDFCRNWIQKHQCESCRPYGHTVLNFSTSLDVFTHLRLVVTIYKGRTIPVQTLRVPGSWGSRTLRQSAHEDGKTDILTVRPALPYRKYTWYSFLSKVELRAIVRSEGLCQWKISVAPSGIDPATSRLVAQCLNQLRHRVSRTLYVPPGINLLAPELFFF